jgi:hypothetical protein
VSRYLSGLLASIAYAERARFGGPGANPRRLEDRLSTPFRCWRQFGRASQRRPLLPLSGTIWVGAELRRRATLAVDCRRAHAFPHAFLSSLAPYIVYLTGEICLNF